IARLSVDTRGTAASAGPLPPACSKGAGLPASVSVITPVASGSTLVTTPIRKTINNQRTMLQVYRRRYGINPRKSLLGGGSCPALDTGVLFRVVASLIAAWTSLVR